MKVDDLFITADPPKLTKKQQKEQVMIDDLQRQIFKHLNLDYSVNNVLINQEEQLHTVMLPTTAKDLQYIQNFVIGHGFGASSLMTFSVLEHLLTKGNVILMETRGMGLNIKPNKLQIDDLQDIEDYFLQGIKRVLQYYQFTNATLICHSFSAYLSLLFIIRHQDLTKKHIKQLLMLSPVGLTPQEDDYKNNIRSCSDFIHLLTHKLGWTFNLSYKSPLRTCLSCCKKKLIMNSLNEENLSEKDKELAYAIFDVLIKLPDGSENLFYRMFQPRVLPKIALEPLFLNKPHIPMVMVFGGNLDWVDRKGPQKVAARFPDMVTLVEIPGITHNIAFHTTQCRELFVQLFRD